MITSTTTGTGQYSAYDENSQYIYGVRETRKQKLKSKLEKRPLPSTYGQQALLLLNRHRYRWFLNAAELFNERGVILLQIGRIQDAIRGFHYCYRVERVLCLLTRIVEQRSI